MPLIEAREITKVYCIGDVEVNALSSVSLTLEKGEFVAIMGPSGSGKSTFMNILGCLDKPTGGKYLLEDMDVSNLDRDERAGLRNSKIGFVFHGFNLLSRTSALENVELPMLYNGFNSRERKQRAMMALKSMGLEGREHHYPNQLSGGQQQRVAIARALVTEPSIMLCDEPTASLDIRSVGIVMEELKMLSDSGKSVIVVTHDLRLKPFADRIIYVNNGIASDKPSADELFHN